MALWHVLHADGDEEDLEEGEISGMLLDDEASDEREGCVDAAAALHSYCNATKGAPQLIGRTGLAGLQSELVAGMDMVHEGLRNRGSALSKEERRAWETGVKCADTNAVSELRDLLLSLERYIWEVQTVEDARDEEEEGRLQAERRVRMLGEGWVFLPDAPPPDPLSDPLSDPQLAAEATEPVNMCEVMGNRGRRFFPGLGYSDGTVVAYLAGEFNDGVELWHIRHEDGDVEDLDRAEVEEAIRCYRHDVRECEEEEGGEGNDKSEGGEDAGSANDEGETENTLWPSAGVRERWQEAVRNSRTHGEVSLALCALLEQAKNFGVVEEGLDGGSGYGPRMFSSPRNKKRSSYGRQQAALVSQSGRVQRATAAKRISYCEL